jgi:ligand-binding sensor domain-containing protein
MQSKIKYIFILFICFTVLLSCNQTDQKSHPGSFSAKITTALHYTVVPDSLSTFIPIPVNEKKLKKVEVGNPSVVYVEKNVHKVFTPTKVVAGQPKRIIPGSAGFQFPRPIPVADKPVAAGIPETFMAKDMVYKVQNPLSIASFGKIQGLRNTIVTCLLQDTQGNIWIGTASGVTKYNGYSFTNFTTEQGLANNNVRAVIQDRKGNIWFGTYGGGVTKYDGYTMTSFSEKNGLCNNYVSSIAEDKSGNIWLGTLGGVIKYDGRFFTNFTKKEGLVNDSVYAVIADRSNNVWMGTVGGVSCYDGHSFANYTEKEGLGNHTVYSILEDRAGDIWMGTLGGISVLQGGFFLRYTSKEGLINDEVFSLLEDRDQHIWIGTHYGLSQYDGKSIVNYSEKQGLTNDNIYCLLQDSHSNIWLGTGGGGILKYNPHSFTHITETEGLPKNYIFAVYEDRKKNLWFGAWRGGVSEYNGDQLKNFTTQQGLPYNDVRSICQDKNGNIWFATYKGVAKYDGHAMTRLAEKDGLVNDDVNCIFEDRSGNLWFGTESGVSKYDGHSFTNFFCTGSEAIHVNSINQTHNGTIWFATSMGLFEYNSQGISRLDNADNLLHTNISSICEDKNSCLWLGTDKGIIRYDGRSFVSLTQREGLLNNDVTSILEDHFGNLWFGTRLGLSKLSAEKIDLLNERIRFNLIHDDDIFFKNYGYTDNFLGISCNAGAIAESADHHIWIGTSNGITTFDPATEPRDTSSMSIQVTAVKIANQTINWKALKEKPDTSFLLNNGIWFSHFHIDSLSRWNNLPKGLKLAYNNNYISFDFVAPTTNQPHTVKYQYQLEGFDKVKSPLNTQSSVSYANLRPGHYTFKARAMNSDGIWSGECRYQFSIMPPWWQTWWFIMLAICIVLAIVFFVSRFIYTYQLHRQKLALEKELAVQYERQRISADLHDEIGATLSSINIYSNLAKTESNKEPYLESISTNVNDAVSKLDDLVWKINPKYDTLDSVIYRLMFYAEPVALAKNISLNLKASDELRRQKLGAETKHQLFLVLKELLNNALKHSGCRAIQVIFSIANNQLQVLVEDDGKGFDEERVNVQRNGLQNIYRRIQLMQGTITTKTGNGAGTLTTINLPLA